MCKKIGPCFHDKENCDKKNCLYYPKTTEEIARKATCKA